MGGGRGGPWEMGVETWEMGDSLLLVWKWKLGVGTIAWAHELLGERTLSDAPLDETDPATLM